MHLLCTYVFARGCSKRAQKEFLRRPQAIQLPWRRHRPGSRLALWMRMALDTHVAILTVAVCAACGTRPALTLATRQSTHVAFNEKWQQVHAISVHMAFKEQQNG